jgi:hypothetical protein
MTSSEFIAQQRTRLQMLRNNFKLTKAQFDSPQYQEMKAEYEMHDPVGCAMVMRHDQQRLCHMEEQITYLARKLECS